MVFCEEKINGTVPVGTPSICRGKVCWITREDCKNKHHKLLCFFDLDINEININFLKEGLVCELKNIGFVFFANVVYRYTLRGNKLKEIGVNFHYIK